MPVLEDLYYAEADLKSPWASPVFTPGVLRRFPPTLIITATRAAELSSAVHTHAELVRLGVQAQLNVWEGLDHAFFTDRPDLPESRAAFDVMAAFFLKHLQ